MPNAFNKAAATWDEDPRRVAMAGAVSRSMLAHLTLTPRATLLDYGAGTGLISLALAPHVGQVLAVDSSEGMLTTLRAKLDAGGISNVRPLLWDVTRPLADLPAADVVTGSMVLHHVEDIAAAAAVFHTLLRPGGQAAFADLDPDDGEFHGAAMHTFHSGFDREWLGGVFTRAGFASVAFHEAHRVRKKTAGGQEREFSVFLMTAVRG